MPLIPNRRDLIRTAWAGFGNMALTRLAAAERAKGSLTPREPMLQARAKRVIFLCMRGGPSHMETFDPKPRLTQDHGKPGRVNSSKLLGSRWAFRKSGQSGIEVVDLLPETARQADKLCVLRGMHTDNENHPQALEQLHTGSFQFIRPSLGSWVLHGLGTANGNLPGFVSINPLTALGGQRYYQSAFLPAACSATLLGDAQRPVANPTVGNLAGGRLSPALQREQLDFLQSMNAAMAGRTADPRVDGVIQSYELAYRMQDELPRVMDFRNETAETLRLYGIGQPGESAFARQCLLARRLAESGVRFVEVTHLEWDLHGSLNSGMVRNCGQIDRPVAGLLADLDRRGMLDETLVIWGGEFGRTPDDPTQDGRGHNNKGYCMWMAGGGVKGGHVHGATDDHGYEAVDGKVHIHDLHATILHLLGLDHERLTFRHGGRDFRLTDVHGRVVKEIIA